MTKLFQVGEEVDCSQSNLSGRWVVEDIHDGKGKDGEQRLVLRSTDPDHTGKEPVWVTASACSRPDEM